MNDEQLRQLLGDALPATPSRGARERVWSRLEAGKRRRPRWRLPLVALAAAASVLVLVWSRANTVHLPGGVAVLALRGDVQVVQDGAGLTLKRYAKTSVSSITTKPTDGDAAA